MFMSLLKKNGRTAASLEILYVLGPLNIYCHWNAKCWWWKIRCFKFSALNQYKMWTLRLCCLSCFLQSFPKPISCHSIHLLQMAALFDLFSVCIALCFLIEAAAEQKATRFLPCWDYHRTHPTGWNHLSDKKTSHAGKSHRFPVSSLSSLW